VEGFMVLQILPKSGSPASKRHANNWQWPDRVLKKR